MNSRYNDIFDNFYYNLRNVKSLEILEDEYFVDYPKIFQKEYEVSFPEYNKEIHFDYTGFCIFGKKEKISPKNSYDDSYIYLKDGEFRFYQKSRSICDRLQFFYDRNFHVRKDFFEHENVFMPDEYFDSELSNDPYSKMLIDNSIRNLKKTEEIKRGNFMYSNNFRGGLDRWGDNVSFTLSGGKYEDNSFVFKLNYYDDKDIVKYLNSDMKVFENLEELIFLFGFMPVELKLHGDSKKNGNFVSFRDAINFMKGK